MKTIRLNGVALAVAVVLLIPLVTEAASKVAFDNQSGTLALVKLAGPTATSVSVENGKKESMSVAPGHYYIKIRYGTPGAYSYSKGDEFDITETSTIASDITITLHKVVAGNYGSKSISEADFGADERTDKRAGQADWATLDWSKTNIKEVEKLAKNQDADPISAYLGSTEISKYENANAPTPAQKKWLEAVATETKPRAKELLRKEFKQAADANDLRGCIISLGIASKVETNMLTDVAGVVAGIKSRVVAGKLGKEFQPLWKVEPAAGHYLDGTYSEGSDLTGRFSLTAKAGFRLLRVTTHIQNLSATSDPSYISYIHPLLLHTLMETFQSDETGKPRRLASDQFAFLLTPGGDWISCGHVGEWCDKLRGLSMTVRAPDGSGIMINSGRYVEQDEKFEADMIFSVPEGIEDFRFLFLGSTPVAVKIANDKAGR